MRYFWMLYSLEEKVAKRMVWFRNKVRIALYKTNCGCKS